jgi:2-C-methyl-D-erythritol 4-phosphate cytidylyltransferase/2-C-methyl-D-erythritol 2,4-cyclodiphosphate synthase
MTMETAALVVAAGVGTRAGDGLPKQYRRIAGKAVLAHAVDALLAHQGISTVQVVIGPDQEALYADAIKGRDLPPPIIGGLRRRDSVRNGLAAIQADRVLIHDAARPFLPEGVINRLLHALDDQSAAVPVLAVADTLAQGDERLGPVVPREGLVRVQTPQAFHVAAIRDAHDRWGEDRDATDDAQVARAAGLAVGLVEGSPLLDKLTYPQDFAMAEQRLAPTLVSRTATGFDVHVFGPGDGVWMGGILIPHDKGLTGHSDADVALHAITDAVLGTIGAGDIGTHFPPSDPRWKGAASDQFLAHAHHLVRAEGGRIDHVDVTIICEEPKIGPHRGPIRARIAQILELDERQVSVKATTTEQMGFTGRREGIAAQAAATVRLPERA